MSKVFWISLFLCVFKGLAVSAGPLEVLSKGAFYATGNRCESFSAAQAATDLKRLSAEVCDGSSSTTPLRGVPDSVQAVNELVNYMNSDSEDQLFALLAAQQSKELLCAADFSKSLSSGKADEALLQNISEKLELARIAKQNLAQAAHKLATDPNVTTRVCPLEAGENLANLKAEFPQELHDSPTFKLCQEIITHRQAFNAIVGTIPLSGLPEVQKYVDDYVGSKEAPKRTLQSVYQEAEKTLRNNSDKLMKTLAGPGAKSFKRQDRYQLLSDPALTERILSSFPKDSQKNLQGLVCQADAKYGKGSDALETGAMVISLAASGGVGLLSKTGMYVTRAAALAGEARAAGVISLGSMRILQASALALDTGAAIAATNRACSDLLVSNLKLDQACTSAPSVEKIEQEDCVLNASLTALGYASVIPPSALKFNRIKDRSNVASKQSKIWQERALGNRVAADKLEAEVVSNLSSGKIVASREIGTGITKPYFVRFEDGTEGIWKSGVAEYGSSKKELAVYKLDKELGVNLVPVVVPRRLEGVEGTVQLRVTSLRKTSGDHSPDEFSLFDYLISNDDRNNKNYLQTATGKPVAIDHGLAFEPPTAFGTGVIYRFNERVKKLKDVTDERTAIEKKIALLKRGTSPQDKKSVSEMQAALRELKLKESNALQDMQVAVPDKQVVDKLRKTSSARWRELLGGELTDKELAGLGERQANLLKILDDAEAKVGRDRLYRDAPYSPVFKKRYYED